MANIHMRFRGPLRISTRGSKQYNYLLWFPRYNYIPLLILFIVMVIVILLLVIVVSGYFVKGLMIYKPFYAIGSPLLECSTEGK